MSLLLRSFKALTLPVIFVTSLASAQGTDQEGLSLRALLRDFIHATEIADPAVRAERVRESLVDHSEVFEWVRDNRDLNELLSSARLEIPASEITGSTQLKRVSEAISSQLGEWVGERTGNAKSGRKVELLSNLVLDQDLIRSNAIRAFVGLNRDERIVLLRSIGDAPFLRITESAENGLKNTKLSSGPALQLLESQDAGADISGVPEEMKRLFHKLLGAYFDALPLQDKRPILLAVLELPLDASLGKQLSAVLQNSGPALQKLFQLAAKDAKSAVVKEAMEELLASVKPVPSDQVRQAVEKTLGKSLEEVFTRFDFDVLGAGTIGQVHAALLKDGTEVIVKILRPGIVEHAQREVEMLNGLVRGNKAYEEILRKVAKTLFDEMDFRVEAKAMDRAAVYHRPKKGITSSARYTGIPVYRDLLVQYRAPGVPMSKLSVDDLLNKGQALQNAMEVWLEEALFGTGFFHADPQKGNLIFESRLEGSPPFQLTFIDFGNADRLTLKQRRAFVRLAGGVAAKSHKMVIEALKTVCKFKGEQFKVFESAVRALDLRAGSTDHQINTIISLALKAEAEIPTAFLRFQRGRMLLESQLDEVNLDLERHAPWIEKRFDRRKILAKVGAKGALKEIVTFPKYRVITPGFVVEVTGQSIQSQCQLLYQSIWSRPAN